MANNDIRRLVLTHKDRLLKFDAELIFSICEEKQIEVVLINQGNENSFEEELAAADRLLKKENDNPSVGLILCKSKSKIQVEIALQDIKKPIGVSDYLVEIEKIIPKELKSSLPTIEEIEAELEKDMKHDNAN